MTVAKVKLWGRVIGGVSWETDKSLAFFEYVPEFMKSEIEAAPLMMPLSAQIYAFPALSRNTFYGLPGMLADCLPDKFGNLLINAWLEGQGRAPESFNPVERLCYTGKRGMGALEFEPAQGPAETKSKKVDIKALVSLANKILSERSNFKVSLLGPDHAAAMKDILRVGTSAGGARAKAVIAWNPQTQEVRSGQVESGTGFSYWILKFDGIEGNKDKELNDPQGYGVIEYAYYKMAIAAGIEMAECRLLKENGRNHFITKRFDRTEAGAKIHMQSLSAIAHYDFNMPGAYSYEQAMLIIRKLNLPMHAVEQQFRRTAFNIIARNQDDHVKNIAFLMDKSGQWSLSPAFDMVYSYNSAGAWTSQHQMSLNEKRDNFDEEDFLQLEKNASMKRGRGREILAEVKAAVLRWREFAMEAGVLEKDAGRIEKTHRIHISGDSDRDGVRLKRPDT